MLLSRSKVVFGEGNPNADIVFCGEAPGKTEDKEGRPFCGEAGRLLDNIIKACGWKRDEVYILNTVKCHPDNNRVPSQEEVANCRPYLDLQLKVIKPKIIVCLGATAAQNLLKCAEPVSKLRNSWYHYVNEPVKAKVRVTFHPAYLLRNPADKSKVWDDMQEVLKELHNG
jgi:DNA polymerase